MAIKEGVVALIQDADGSGSYGVSFGLSNGTWSAPILSGGGGVTPRNNPVFVTDQDYTLNVNDDLIVVESPNVQCTIYMPPPSTVPINRVYTIKINNSINERIRVQTNFGSIDGDQFFDANNSYDTYKLKNTGTVYFLI